MPPSWAGSQVTSRRGSSTATERCSPASAYRSRMRPTGGTTCSPRCAATRSLGGPSCASSSSTTWPCRCGSRGRPTRCCARHTAASRGDRLTSDAQEPHRDCMVAPSTLDTMTTRRPHRDAALHHTVTRPESDWVDADGAEIHDHDRGLLYDLGTMNRRRALGLLGGVSALAALAACGTNSGTATSSSTADATADRTGLTEVDDETA